MTRVAVAVSALAALLVLASCGDLFGPGIGPPAEMLRLAGDDQTAVVGERLGDTLVVRVRDSGGRAVEGAVVAWSAADGSGDVRPAQDTTDLEGVARTAWTLGTRAGEQVVEASTQGVTARFTATATPGAPAAAVAEDGDGQEAGVTLPLDDALVVLVTDRYDNPVPDVAVEWSVRDDDGVLERGDSVTDARGLAAAHWTLGASSGRQLAFARVTTRLITFAATGLPGAPSGLAVVSGDGQEAPAGEVLPDTLRVKLHDAHDNPIPGVAAAWKVLSGGGTLTVPEDTTNVDGLAWAIWKIGEGGDPQRAEVAVAGRVVEFTAGIRACDRDSPDSDGDRLPDCAETATGIYAAVWDTGTDPDDPDTDGDGISDGDEVLGTVDGLDLPALGVSPVRRDLLLEYDWFRDANDCDLHTHRPTVASAEAVRRMFADAPGRNPDGSTGVHVIQDYGQGGAFTGGNLIDDADGVLSGGVFGSEFVGYKTEHFAPEREDYFHYVILPHRYNRTSNSSGQAVVYGMDMIVSLQCFVGNTSAVANTIAHELGHNLGLLHGGGDNLNWKPNYSSVMNYAYQFGGVDTDCVKGGDRVLDFSRGSLPGLDENDLDERTGICGDLSGPGWDWNGNGITGDTAVVADINVDFGGDGDGRHDVLTDYDDWSNLFFYGPVTAPGFAFRAEPEAIVCQDVPPLPEH